MSIYVLIWPDIKLHKWPIAKTIMHKSGDLCFYQAYTSTCSTLAPPPNASSVQNNTCDASLPRTHPAASVQVCVRSSNSRVRSGWKSASLAAGGGHVWQLPPSQHEPGGRVQCCPPGVQQAPELGAPLIASTAQSSPVPSGPGSVQSAAPPGKDQVAAVQASQPQAKQAPRQ